MDRDYLERKINLLLILTTNIPSDILKPGESWRTQLTTTPSPCHGEHNEVTSYILSPFTFHKESGSPSARDLDSHRVTREAKAITGETGQPKFLSPSGGRPTMLCA